MYIIQTPNILIKFVIFLRAPLEFPALRKTMWTHGIPAAHVKLMSYFDAKLQGSPPPEDSGPLRIIVKALLRPALKIGKIGTAGLYLLQIVCANTGSLASRSWVTNELFQELPVVMNYFS